MTELCTNRVREIDRGRETDLCRERDKDRYRQIERDCSFLRPTYQWNGSSSPGRKVGQHQEQEEKRHKHAHTCAGQKEQMIHPRNIRQTFLSIWEVIDHFSILHT